MEVLELEGEKREGVQKKLRCFVAVSAPQEECCPRPNMGQYSRSSKSSRDKGCYLDQDRRACSAGGELPSLATAGEVFAENEVCGGRDSLEWGRRTDGWGQR